MNEDKKPQTEAEWLEYLHIAMYDKEKAEQHRDAVQSTIERQHEALSQSIREVGEASIKISEAVSALKALWR